MTIERKAPDGIRFAKREITVSTRVSVIYDNVILY